MNAAFLSRCVGAGGARELCFGTKKLEVIKNAGRLRVHGSLPRNPAIYKSILAVLFPRATRLFLGFGELLPILDCFTRKFLGFLIGFGPCGKSQIGTCLTHEMHMLCYLQVLAWIVVVASVQAAE